MREIRMKSLSAGPEGIFHPGHTRTLLREEAATLVKAGHAEYTVVESPEKAVVKPPQMEVVEPDETADEPKRPRGRQKK